MGTKIGFDSKLAVTTPIDWNKISSTVTKSLNDLKERRQKAREDTDTDYRDLIKKFQNEPQSQSDILNTQLSEMSQQIQNAALADKRMFQSGAMTAEEYNRKKANRLDSTQILLDTYKKKSNDYDEIISLVESNDPKKRLSGVTLAQRAQLEQIFEFKGFQYQLDPLTNEGNMVKKDDKGNVIESFNASELAFMKHRRYNAFDSAKASEDIAKAIGTQTFRDAAGTTVKGFNVGSFGEEYKKDLDKAKREAVKAVLTDDNAMAYLFDTVKFIDGKEITVTNSVEEALKNEAAILIGTDGNPILTRIDEKDAKAKNITPEQIKKLNEKNEKLYNLAVDNLDDQVTLKLDRSKEAKVPTESDKDRAFDRRTGRAKDVAMATDLALVHQGQELADRKVGATQLGALDDTITRILEYPNKIEVYRIEPGATEETFITVDMSQGTERFVRGGASTFGVEYRDINDAVKRSGIDFELKRNRENIGNGTVLFERKKVEKPKKKSKLEIFRERANIDFGPESVKLDTVIDTNKDPDVINDDLFASKLAPILKNYGFTVEPFSRFNPNEGIKLQSSTDVNQRKEFELENLDTPEANLQKVLNDIQVYIEGTFKKPEDAAVKVIKEGKRGGIDYTQFNDPD